MQGEQHPVHSSLISRLCGPETPCGSRCAIYGKTPLRTDLDTTWQDRWNPASFFSRLIVHVLRCKTSCQESGTKPKYQYHWVRNHVRVEWSFRCRRAFRRDNRTVERTRLGCLHASAAALPDGFLPRAFPCPWHPGFFAIQTQHPSRPSAHPPGLTHSLHLRALAGRRG